MTTTTTTALSPFPVAVLSGFLGRQAGKARVSMSLFFRGSAPPWKEVHCKSERPPRAIAPEELPGLNPENPPAAAAAAHSAADDTSYD